MNSRAVSPELHIVWVQPSMLSNELSAATYLDTTRELRALNCQVTLVCPGPAGKQSIRGVEVLCISRPDVYFLGQLVFHLKTVRLLFAEWSRIDCIVCREISALWFLPLRFLRFLRNQRRPLIVMDTRSMHMPPPDKSSLKIRVRGVFIKLMTALANQWADGRTAITWRMADELHIPRSKLWGIWTSGVTLEHFAPAQAERQWPRANEPVNLIYIGSLEYERNIMGFCRAVVRANAEGMSFIFTIVGDGPERKDLESYVRQAGTCLRILGSIPYENIPQILSEAHVGILPFPNEIRFQVSSPIKLFEYVAAGIPILATRVICHTSVVGDRQYAFWAEQSDENGFVVALRQVWQSRASLNLKGMQASEAAKAWTWHQSANKLKMALEHGLTQAR